MPGSRPTTPQSRPTTPTRASVNVPMGAVAFIDSRSGAWVRYECVNGTRTSTGTATQNAGLRTTGMTTCFTVMLVGTGGAVLCHVSAYLSHTPLTTAQAAELNALKAAFAKIMKDHGSKLNPMTVVLVPGPNPMAKTAMDRVVGLIFPQISLSHAMTLPCKPATGLAMATPSTGTAQVMVAHGSGSGGNKVYVEDKQTHSHW